MYPGDDPELIIYMALKMPKNNKGYVSNAVKDIVVNLSKYYNIELNLKVCELYLNSKKILDKLFVLAR